MPLPVLLVVAGIFIVLLGRAVLETIALRKLRKVDGRKHDMAVVARYFIGLEQPCAALPAQAWTDLDMDDVFQKIDRTASWPGQHLLYARLRCEDHSLDALGAFDAAVNQLAADDRRRASVRAALKPLDDWRASDLPALFQGVVPSAPAFARAFPLLSIVALACLGGAIWWPPLAVVVAGLVVLNAFIRAALRDRINRFVPAMRMLPALLRASQTLATFEVPALAPWTHALQQVVPKLHWIGRAARWLTFEPDVSNELAGYVYEYLNLLFLLDVSAFAWSVAAIRDEQDTISRAYVALGEIDVRQAVATVRRERSDWTRPAFLAARERSLAFVALTHPLIDRAIPNTLTMAGHSVLLTGSNMSGKSTFIRTVGVNAVLAQTINTVFAESWRAPRFAIRTSIGRGDSLLEGTSYYQAEVNAVGALLDIVSAEQHLVLIDELFRGTNSIERIAAAKAVLAQLDRDEALVIVATHDVELLELVPEYISYHFREEIRDNQLTFDYQLRPGASSTRNALAILELAGYPDAVLGDARATASLVEQRAIGVSRAST